MSSIDDKKAARLLLALAAAVGILSAAYSFYYHDRPRVDASAYDRIGWNVARGIGYVEDEAKADNPKSDEAIIRVGPGYQFFLAGVYKAFGHRIPVVWILQALLRAASVLLLFYVVKLLIPGENRIAILAAAIFGFMPDLIVINGLLLTETLFVFLLLSAVYFSLRVIPLGGATAKWGVYAAGFFWALAILTRPISLLPFGLVVIYFLWKKYFISAALVLLFPLILVGSWSYYVSSRYGSFILTTTVGGYDLWVGNNSQATGGFDKTPEIQEARGKYSSVELDKIGRQKYFEFLFSDPLAFSELQLRKAALYFSLARPGGYWAHLLSHPWHLRVTLAASFLATAFLFIFGIAGAYAWWREQKGAAGKMFLAFAVMFPIAVIPIIVETRYRYPLFPFLAIFAAYFLLRREAWTKPLASASAAALFFTAYDVFSNFPEIIEKISRVL